MGPAIQMNSHQTWHWIIHHTHQVVTQTYDDFIDWVTHWLTDSIRSLNSRTEIGYDRWHQFVTFNPCKQYAIYFPNTWLSSFYLQTSGSPVDLVVPPQVTEAPHSLTNGNHAVSSFPQPPLNHSGAAKPTASGNVKPSFKMWDEGKTKHHPRSRAMCSFGSHHFLTPTNDLLYHWLDKANQIITF